MNGKAAKPPIFIRNQFMTQPWLKTILSEHFDLVDNERQAKVDVDWRLPNAPFYEVRGKPLVMLCFWDAYLDQRTHRDGDVIFFFARDWVRIHEYYWATQIVDTEQICHQRNQRKFMLMLMNLRRDHRDLAALEFMPYLNDSLWTYLERGQSLPEDPITMDQSVSPWGFDHRGFIESWYADTAFSMVIESRVEDRLFVSEKIFKPLRHGHPFMVYGSPGILQYLRDQGFQTFATELDESYDVIENPSAPYASYPAAVAWDTTARFQAIKQQVSRLHMDWQSGKKIFDSPHTHAVLEHNRNAFFNSKSMARLVRKQIIGPLMEIVESV